MCNKITINTKQPDLNTVDDELITELCPRIWALAVEYQMCTIEEKERCFLETLLKGVFSLLAIKSPKVAIKVSASCMQVFF